MKAKTVHRHLCEAYACKPWHVERGKSQLHLSGREGRGQTKNDSKKMKMTTNGLEKMSRISTSV